MREFKVTEGKTVRVYKGFSDYETEGPKVNKGSAVLVAAWFDGEPELYLCDDQDGINELRRYYTDDWGDRDIPFETFTPVNAA